MFIPMERMSNAINARVEELKERLKINNEEISYLETRLDRAKRDNKKLEEENKKLKERIDVLYEFIERNDKLVDEVINEEDLDKLNRYIYIDDDLVDRALESEN